MQYRNVHWQETAGQEGGSLSLWSLDRRACKLNEKTVVQYIWVDWLFEGHRWIGACPWSQSLGAGWLWSLWRDRWTFKRRAGSWHTWRRLCRLRCRQASLRTGCWTWQTRCSFRSRVAFWSEGARLSSFYWSLRWRVCLWSCWYLIAIFWRSVPRLKRGKGCRCWLYRLLRWIVLIVRPPSWRHLPCWS